MKKWRVRCVVCVYVFVVLLRGYAQQAHRPLSPFEPNVNGPSPFEPGDRLLFGLSSSSKLFPFCSRCSRIFRANVRNASSMLIFCLQETSKNGISKFSAICMDK